MVEAHGCRLHHLSPYSPDFNPIEEGFSSMKAWIWHNHKFILTELNGDVGCNPYRMLWDTVFESMTPDKIIGWYRDSGYVV
jgi:transposase